ncbi:hypothetical protein JCM1393_00520 [Clostridium carnis]
MSKLDIKIQINLNDLSDVKEVIKEVKDILEKECNCTCTLDLTITH